MNNEIKMSISSSLKNLSFIRSVVRLFLENQNIEKQDSLQIITMIDELSTNAIEHGYEYKLGTLVIEVQKLKNVIKLVVEDCGNGFDDSKTSKEEGGMGLFLARKMADNFKIEKKINGTRIKIEKIVREEVNNDSGV